MQRRQRVQNDDLSLRRIGVAIAPQVFLVEARAQLGGVVGLGDADLDRMVLALVAHFDLAIDRDYAVAEFALQCHSPFGFQFGEYRCHLG